MMSTFENEAIHYCFLNVWLTLGLTKKIIRKRNQTVVTERFGYVKRFHDRFSQKLSEGDDNFVLGT